jgi:hypothetical protein
MKTNFFKMGAGLLLALSITMIGCQDDENLRDNQVAEENLTEAASVGDSEADDALDISQEVEADLLNNAGNTRTADSFGECAVVTNDEESKTITIDFGTGCIGGFGVERSGKIFVNYSGSSIGDNLAKRVITFENYVVNNKGVSGTIELGNRNFDGDTLVSVHKLINLTVTFPNEKSVVYNGERTRKWYAGVQDGDPSNNEFIITGSVQGVWSDGGEFTHEIVTPIISKWSCRLNDGYFARVAGVVEVKKLRRFVERTRRVDYGNGECDSFITVTVGNRTYTISINDAGGN